MHRLALILIFFWFGLGSASARIDAEPLVQTEHFHFYHAEGDPRGLQELADYGSRSLARMCQEIPVCDTVRFPFHIWVADDADSFADHFADGNPIREWAAGVAFLEHNRIILRAHGTALMSLHETFDHEIAHLLLHAAIGKEAPRWFHEGFAIWLSGQKLNTRLEEALKAASLGSLLPFESLQSQFPRRGQQVTTAYAQSGLAVRRMSQLGPPHSLRALIHTIQEGRSFDDAFTEVYRITPAALFDDLKATLEDASSPWFFFHDGQLVWALTAIFFVFVAGWRLRKHRLRMRRLAEEERLRIAREDAAALHGSHSPHSPRSPHSYW